MAAATRHLVRALCISTLLALTAPAVADSYAEDRAKIEDLMGRYIFAFDWYDADAYAATFTEDGVLVWGRGELRGRDAIRKMVQELRDAALKRRAEDGSGLRPARGRHHITNLVVSIDGDRAFARAYWVVFGNDNPERRATVGAYGHYEDELVKRDGQWLFKRREVFNEQLERRAASDVFPLSGLPEVPRS